MPVKEKILKELKKGPVRYKKLRFRFKKSARFMRAMEELRRRGIILEKDGMVSLRRARDRPDAVREDTLTGTVVKLAENFGFVRVADMDRDVYVSGKYMMGAVPGDEVRLKRVRSSGRDFEGKITRIIKERTNLAAIAQNRGGALWVTLKDCRYLTVKTAGKAKAEDGDIVMVNLIGRGTSHRRLKAQVVSVIGRISSSSKAVEVLLAEKNIHREFSSRLLREVADRIESVDFAREKSKRADLTGLPIFTIDSASTKDIDDAVYVKRTDKGFELSVHIADVSFYVEASGECDREAFDRGTSIYYGESVIPMLPTRYSNDVCSLNENRERLAFSCRMKLDKNGNIISYEFFKSVIRSRVKGVYSEINSILDGTASPEVKNKYARVAGCIADGKRLYDILRARRRQRGSMDIESDEAYIIFDEHGRAVDIKKRERGTAEMMIEEFMLRANSCSANMARRIGLPFVYRVHERPDSEKLEALRENLARLGLSLQQQDGESLQQAMSRVLDKTRDTNLQAVVHRLVLRSQSKAKYSENPVGHFGLGLEDYAHFTSPIRRYPDLAIHRILSYYLQTMDADKTKKRFAKFSARRSTQSSAAELVAMQTERSADDIYKAEIMSAHIGDRYTGTISSVTSFGVYVALDNTVEGLVHISRLNMVNPVLTEGYSLSCPVTGMVCKVGDDMDVVVEDTDILNGNIDFAPADMPSVTEKKEKELFRPDKIDRKADKTRRRHKKEKDAGKRRPKASGEKKRSSSGQRQRKGKRNNR